MTSRPLNALLAAAAILASAVIMVGAINMTARVLATLATDLSQPEWLHIEGVTDAPTE